MGDDLRYRVIERIRSCSKFHFTDDYPVCHERMFFDRWEIKLEGLTHERLCEWMEVLENVDIKIDGIPFHIK